MEDVKRILVVSRKTKFDMKAVEYGASLARMYGAELYVIYVVHDPFGLEGWNLPIPYLEEDYKRELVKDKEMLDKLVAGERARGLKVTDLLKEGDPVKEILQTVKDEKIDLLIMLAHEEGRLEHFLFGRSNEEIIRKIPCSILLVKKGKVKYY